MIKREKDHGRKEKDLDFDIFSENSPCFFNTGPRGHFALAATSDTANPEEVAVRHGTVARSHLCVPRVTGARGERGGFLAGF